MIRVGIVGTSWWTDSMYLPALASHPGCEVVAICGRNAEVAQARADQWGIARVFSDWAELLVSGQIDAVIVASSNATHAAITQKALAEGLHVLCEKPVALSATEADLMAACAADTDLCTMVPSTYQYMPIFAATKRLIDEGFLGTPHHLNLRCSHRIRFGSHLQLAFRQGNRRLGSDRRSWLALALLRRVVVRSIAELGCMSATFVERDRRPDGTDYARSEDSCVVSVRFASGALGTLQTCAVSWEGTPFGQTHHIDAHGCDGTIYATSDWDTEQEVRVLARGDTGPSRPIDLTAQWPTVRFDTVHNTYRDIGGFKWSSQHLDVEVCDGQAVGVVGEADGETGDEVAGASADSSGCGAGVLGEDRRGAHKRGRGDRVRGVGYRRIALVPRTWGNANSRAGSVYGALPVLQ